VSDAPLPRLPFAEEQRLLGVGVRVQRRTARHLRHLPALEAAAAALLDPSDDVVAARLAALRGRLWRAPAWRARLRAAGLSPDDLRSLDDLAHLPVLERDELAASWQELADVDGDPELHLATTSGSTGVPLLVPRSGYDGLHMWAVLRFWVARLGVALPPRPRLVLLCTLPGGLEYSVRAPQFFGGALHRISTVRPRALERLRRAAPAILSTDPAGLHWLLAHDAPRPRLVLSSASHLAPALRADAEAALAAPLVNYVATTETGPIAWECRVASGRFHVLHPDVAVRAHAGRLDVTRLRDSPLPLIRYRTGDRGEVEHGECACGARGETIVGFGGREACPFLRPDGSSVDAWTLSWLFKDIPLVGFQLAQVGPQAFQLALDAAPPIGLPLLVLRLRLALRRLGFPEPAVAAGVGALAPAAKPRPFLPWRPGAAAARG
jgi:phenylacetate-CoA ligase